MIEYLDSKQISTEGMVYGAIRQLYWDTKRVNGELLSQINKKSNDASTGVLVKDIDTTQNSPLFGSPRHELLKEIVPFMKTMVGRSRGTNKEIQQLIYLHNSFYNRRDSIGCSTCVGSVFNRMTALYKKYKQYYD